MELEFYAAVRLGDLPRVKKLLDLHPDLDLNRPSPTFTPLHNACWLGHTTIAAFLLKQPGIQVNSLTPNGFTPFFYACTSGKVDIVRILLRDPRVDVNMTGDDGKTPLWRACHSGHEQVVHWMIASGREFDWEKPAVDWDGIQSSPSAVARMKGFPEISQRINAFLTSPALVRFEARVELQVPGELAASTFALVVLLCDEHLQLAKIGPRRTHRFFRIMASLPMELQMMVCHRVYESAEEYVPRETSEMAFRSLVRRVEVGGQTGMARVLKSASADLLWSAQWGSAQPLLFSFFLYLLH